ncbi:hypothetical protein [Haloarcula sediminis]|uniref:hypothetical protein n=1 Tax=Haloarcula sediminis TaxID=3111777 RepID=UPI002D774F04|nr:hypothetical protein [Haloarcula sp. CK38]
MNAVQILYPYVLAALNIAVAWLSYVLLTPDFAVPFLAIGLLVFVAVVGQTAARYISGRTRASRRRETS